MNWNETHTKATNITEVLSTHKEKVLSIRSITSCEQKDKTHKRQMQTNYEAQLKLSTASYTTT